MLHFKSIQTKIVLKCVLISDQGEIRFGGMVYERTGSGNFIGKDGRVLDGGAMGASNVFSLVPKEKQLNLTSFSTVFGGFANSGDLGGFGKHVSCPFRLDNESLFGYTVLEFKVFLSHFHKFDFQKLYFLIAGQLWLL